MEPTVIATILNVVALLGAMALSAWLGIRILRSQSRWPKLLLPILAVIFTFAALALITFPLSFSGSAESQVQQTIEIDP